MAKILNKTYTLRNVKTDEIITACGMTKVQACANAKVSVHQYSVVNVVEEYEQLTIAKHLTNADLIAILMQRDPNAEVDIMIDYSVFGSSQDYSDIDEYDGVCFVKEHNRLVINAGEFEC